MTPPLLTAVASTVHHRRNPAPPGRAHRAMAERVRADLTARQSVVVEVPGLGRGWYVIAVGDGVYELWRDGITETVPWTDVPLSQR